MGEHALDRELTAADEEPDSRTGWRDRRVRRVRYGYTGVLWGDAAPRGLRSGGHRGRVWTLEDQGRIALQCQVNFPESLVAKKHDEKQRRHTGLLQRVLGGGEGLLVPPHGGAGEEGEAATRPISPCARPAKDRP